MHSFISNHLFKFSRIHVRRIAAQCGIQLSDNYFSRLTSTKRSYLFCVAQILFFFLWRATIFALIFDTLYKYFSFFLSFFSPHPLQIKLEFERLNFLQVRLFALSRVQRVEVFHAIILSCTRCCSFPFSFFFFSFYLNQVRFT